MASASQPASQPAKRMCGAFWASALNYYRRFVHSFVDVAKPLHVLTEERSPFLWTSSCQQAFEALKTALTQTPILVLPTVDDDFMLDTDASNVGIGAILSSTKDGKDHYLYGRQFTVQTDHSALQWLMMFRTPEGQIARWLQKLQDYDFIEQAANMETQMQYPEDPVRKTASVGTRAETTPTKVKQDHSNECQVQRTTLKPDERSNRSPEDLQREQRNDPSLGIIINWLEVSRIGHTDELERGVSSKSGGEEPLEALGVTEHPRRCPDVPLGDSQPRCRYLASIPSAVHEMRRLEPVS